MLKGQKTILRAITRDDLERLWQFNNDVEVELASGGDPPLPQSLARLQTAYENDIVKMWKRWSKICDRGRPEMYWAMCII